MRNKHKIKNENKSALHLVEVSQIPRDFSNLRLLVMGLIGLAIIFEILLVWPGFQILNVSARLLMTLAFALTTGFWAICGLVYFKLYRRNFTTINYLGMVSVTGTWCFCALATYLTFYLDSDFPLRIAPLCICVQLMALLSASSSDWLKVGNSDCLYDISNCEWSLQNGYKVERRATLKIIYGGLQSALDHRQTTRESILGRGG